MQVLRWDATGLGIEKDAVIAEREGVSVGAVKAARWRRQIRSGHDRKRNPLVEREPCADGESRGR